MHQYYWLIIISLFLFAGCKKKESDANNTQPRPVRVAKVEALGTISWQYTGVVEAQQFSTLAFKVSGTITEFNVKTGQQVKKGEIMAKINPFDYQKQYATAKTNYQTAKSIYERTQRLFAANAVARQNLEIAEADYVRAGSALDIAKLTLDYTVLTAPFDGFIEQRFVDNFEEILAGQAIVKLVNPKEIEVRFNLPEANIQLLQLPKKIFVEFDTQKGMLFASDIKESVYSSQGSGIPVSLIITDEQFVPYRPYVFPGFSCKVIWEFDNIISDQFFIPPGALSQEDGKEYVWIINPKDMTAHRHPVKTSQFKNQALVEEGLSKDDVIVIAGGSALKEGQKVRIEN